MDLEQTEHFLSIVTHCGWWKQVQNTLKLKGIMVIVVVVVVVAVAVIVIVFSSTFTNCEIL